MQLEFFDIPSPCVGICQTNEKGLCLGCMRSREERSQWIRLSSDDKQKVIKRCQQRKKRQDGKLKEKVKEVNNNEEIQQPSLLDPPAKKVLIDNSTNIDFGDFEL